MIRAVSSEVRASRLHREGRAFNSHTAHQLHPAKSYVAAMGAFAPLMLSVSVACFRKSFE